MQSWRACAPAWEFLGQSLLLHGTLRQELSWGGLRRPPQTPRSLA